MGEVVSVVLRTAASPGSIAASVLVVGDGAVVVSMLAMVDGWCLLTQSACVSLHSVSLSQQQSPVSSHSSSHQQEDLEPLPHWSWQLPAELHTTGKLVFSPPTFRADTGGRKGLVSLVEELKYPKSFMA